MKIIKLYKPKDIYKMELCLVDTINLLPKRYVTNRILFYTLREDMYDDVVNIRNNKIQLKLLNRFVRNFNNAKRTE